MNLVEQLRTWEEMPRCDDDLAFLWLNQLTENAADLIERQAAQIELMREVLNRLQEAGNGEDDNEFYAANSAATKALSTTPDQALEQFAAAPKGEVK